MSASILCRAPFFSVVIPVHNKAQHVGRAIRSVLCQTFSDIELLIVDDASSDGSMARIEHFQDSRIRVYSRRTPGPGGYAARNLGIRESRGTYLAFLDCDDAWMPCHLQRTFEVISLFPEAPLFSSAWIEVNRNCRVTRNTVDATIEKYVEIDLEDYLKSGILGQARIWTGVAVVKKTALNDKRLFPDSTTAKRGGDQFAWLKLLCLYRQLIVSNHVGAEYFRDSINMVTKTAPYGAELFGNSGFAELSRGLTKRESRLLAGYMNRKLFGGWRFNRQNFGKGFELLSSLHWHRAPLNSLAFALASLMPEPLVEKMRLGKLLVWFER